MRLILFAAAGGALGAGLRHVINTAFLAWFGPGFPWATLTVNLVGSLLMGVLVQALMPFDGGAPALRTFLATGILGGFTTFSAFSLDVVGVVRAPAAHRARGLCRGVGAAVDRGAGPRHGVGAERDAMSDPVETITVARDEAGHAPRPLVPHPLSRRRPRLSAEAAALGPGPRRLPARRSQRPPRSRRRSARAAHRARASRSARPHR